ncbi:hypothetical protein BGX21_002938, partial [Mortierella sp. AD011]
QFLTALQKRQRDLNVTAAVDILICVDMAITMGIHADVSSGTTILDLERATHKIAFGVDI